MSMVQEPQLIIGIAVAGLVAVAAVIAVVVVVRRRRTAPKRVLARVRARGEALAEDSEVPPPLAPIASFIDDASGP